MRHLLLMTTFALLLGCATPGQPPGGPADSKPYQKMDDGTGKLACSDKSVLEYRGLCYPPKAARIACAGSARYYVPQDCGAAGFPDGK